MKVLTVYAHHDPHSFCHGVLERFTAGLADAGHTSDVLDLHAIKFDPVFREGDVASYTSGEIPEDILELMDPAQKVLKACRGPVQRFLASRAMRGKSPTEIATMIRSHMPKDVLAQQSRVAAADALAFIAPIHFCSFPSILKGWIDRVFTLDFAFGLTSEGWHGDINGRIPLLRHRRALIMTSTIFDENAYDDGIRDAIAKVIDDWGFRYPGIDDVEHVYFYAATAAPPETIHAYLDRAYQLGKDFDLPRESRTSATAHRTGGIDRPLAIVWQRLVSGGQTCDRCAATQHAVEHAVHVLAQTLRPLGVEPHLEIRELDETSFQQDPSASNRIWIAGKPMEDWLGGTAGSSRCCSVCGDSECRTVEVGGSTYEAVPERLILRAALLAASELLDEPTALQPNLDRAEPITASRLANGATH